MFCRECGSENRNDRKFCSNCGTPLKDYTKPVENTIMPEEIEKKQELVKTSNKAIFGLTIAMICLLVLACVLVTISFFVNDAIKLTLCIIALVFAIAYIVCSIIKSKKQKKLNNINK